MRSKQWIKTTNIGNIPTIYNEPLLTCILDEIQTRGKMNKTTFTQEMDASLSSKYAPVILSNTDSLRYVRGLLVASELVVVEGDDYIINPLATALVRDLVLNKPNINPPSQEEEESYWNSMAHGIFDVINSTNKKLYSSFYPNLIK